MSPDPLPVDELREKLKQLGYLRTGVDRFVLATARHERSAARIAIGAAVRVGLLAGALLGPAAAIGIAARVPQLVTGVRDAIVVAIYLALLFALAGAGVTLAAGLASRAAVGLSGGTVGPRLARLAPAGAGVLVSAACLGYLALWWGAISAGPVWSAPVLTSLALTAAVSISLVIGHAVAVTVGALLARESTARLAPATPIGSRRAAFVFRVIAFAGAASLLVATVQPANTSDVVPEFAVVPTGQRVIVVAIDGVDLRHLEDAQVGFGGLVPLRAAALIAAPVDPDPARDWTTIATGVPPDEHGISELELRRVAGLEGAVARSQLTSTLAAATDLLRLTRPAIASGLERTEKTFWEVAAEKGLATAVVNWWATWPASGPGVVLSDRAMLRLEQGGALDAEIAPAALYDPLRARWPRLSHEADALALDAFLAIGDDGIRKILLRSARLDATVTLLATDAALGRPDLLALYLPGLDILQHALGTDPGADPRASRARLLGLALYYQFLNRLIRPLASGKDVFLVLVTQPGRRPSAPQGLVGAQGLNAAPAGRVTASLMDVAPTVLYALGLPTSRAIGGKALTDLFAEAFVRRVPVRSVDTYGRRIATMPSRGAQPLDKEMLERLRSLGYVR
jgi:Type I phosphodiesterase / nucleotide pyrophosphatase